MLRLEIYLEPGAGDDDLNALDQLSPVIAIPEERLLPADLVALACKIYNARRIRDRYLSASMLGEPVWDMLLALYCFSAKGEALSV